MNDEVVGYNVHPVASVYPMMSDDEFNELVEDIKRKGLIEPVVLHDGVLLDGRNRVKACSVIGVPVKIVAWDGSGGDPASFIVSRNKRRNLTISQRAMVAARLEPYFVEEAKKRQMEGQQKGGHIAGRGRPIGLDSIESKPIEPRTCNPRLSKAAAAAAKLTGVGIESVVRAKKVLNGDRPDLVAAVDAGTITVHRACGLLKAPKRRALEQTHKTMSRRGLRPVLDPLASLVSRVNDVIDTWEHETESGALMSRWQRASAMQRETFNRSLDALMASTRRVKKGLNKDAPKDET